MAAPFPGCWALKGAALKAAAEFACSSCCAQLQTLGCLQLHVTSVNVSMLADLRCRWWWCIQRTRWTATLPWQML